MQFWVHRLQVRKLDGFPQQLLVEGNREAPVDVVPVEHSQTHDAAHKVEVRQMVLQGAAENSHASESDSEVAAGWLRGRKSRGQQSNFLCP